MISYSKSWKTCWIKSNVHLSLNIQSNFYIYFKPPINGLEKHKIIMTPCLHWYNLAKFSILWTETEELKDAEEVKLSWVIFNIT